MDSIFDIFFEHKMQSLERCGLKTRQNRTDVIDHLNAVISGYAEGQNIPPDESCQLAIAAAVNYHRTKKEENSTICMMGKYHNVLYIALKVAWDWGVKDTEIICQLLEEIYSCEKTFERLFLGAIFGTNAPHFIAGWKADFKDQEENCRALVYYLDHATRSRLTFPVVLSERTPVLQLRFIDVPIESCGKASPLRVALQASAPDILLILLRFGANPMPQDDGSNPVVALLDKLIESTSEMQTRRYSFQLVSCLQILIKAAPVVDLPFKPFVYPMRRTMCMQKYGQLLADQIVTVDTLFGIPSLKALSRFVIRDQLRSSAELPRGIKVLPVPGALKRYVDLMEDAEPGEGASD